MSLTFLEEFLSFSFVWFLVRESNAFDNLVDENKNLRDLNAELGDFMALSYWLKFLHPFVAGNIKQKMSQHLACEYGANFKCFQKLIILLPSSCHLHLDENDLERGDVSKHLEHCSDDCESAHSIKFPSTCHGYSDIHQTMHWIYRDTKEETQNRNEKIVVMFHFPQIIRSMMGPGRDWEEKKRPGGRQRNVEQMKEKLVDLLLSNGYGDYEEYLVFHYFKSEELKSCEGVKSLSTLLREKILEEENEESGRIYEQSFSESDSEAEV